MVTSDSSNLRRLREGESKAAQELWQRYFDRLAGLARHILHGVPCRAVDEEDVALSALGSFCRGVERGNYPRLTDHDSLWKLLVVITRRKAFDLVQSQQRLKRGGGKVQGESALAGPGQQGDLDDLSGDEPTPEFVAQMADQCRHLLAVLDDPELQVIARQKMEGYTNEEIAELHHCSLARIERKLRLIREVWTHQS